MFSMLSSQTVEIGESTAKGMYLSVIELANKLRLLLSRRTTAQVPYTTTPFEACGNSRTC